MSDLIPAESQSKRGGLRPGAGRKPTRVKYAPLIARTEKELATILEEDVPIAVRELVRGAWVQEPGLDGKPVIYQKLPDMRAIEFVAQRIMGKVTDDDEAKAQATATVVNIIRNGASLNVKPDGS